MSHSIFPAFAGTSCFALLLVAGREWRMARKVYGTELWPAVRQMTTCWFLTWRYWFLYAATILFCGALGPVFMANYRIDLRGCMAITLLATVAFVTVSWNVIPPAVLFLASSAPLSEPARRLVWSSAKTLGFRSVYLLQGRMKSALKKNLAVINPSRAGDVFFEMDNLRTSDDLIWKDVLHNLIAMVPVVVMDIRSGSEGVSYELDHILDRGFYRKTIFIVDEKNSDNAAEQVIVNRLGPNPNITIVFPTDEELGQRVRESLRQQASVSGVYGKPRDTRRASPFLRHVPITKWLCFRFILTACAALVAGILTHSVLTAQVVVGRPVPHAGNIVFLQSGSDPEEARRQYGVAGGAILGCACAMGISCLRIIWMVSGASVPRSNP